MRRVITSGLVILVIALGALSIVSTYRVFSHTIDEPAHLAAGMELLDRGVFNYEQQHPPLARLAVALGPYLNGAHSHDEADIVGEGLAILYGSGEYQATLSAARFGVLPFFILLGAVASLWAYRDFGEVTAVATAIIIATTPPLLAHAGLATTDLPVTAMFLSSLFAFRLWLDSPNAPLSILLGATAALSVAAKLSALVFLPASFLCAMALRLLCGRQPRSGSLISLKVLWEVAAGIVAFGFVIWLVYGCPTDLLQPLRQLRTGVAQVLEHNTRGHVMFFRGEISFDGHWLFFPTALLVKTPVPLLCLVALGAFVTLCDHRDDWRFLTPLASAAAVLGIAMLSRVNLGVRYVLPMYPLLAMIAAIGVARLLAAGSWVSRGLLSLLLIGLIWTSATSRPDYIAYFNFLAGSNPERLLVDSDLDWGQDVNRVVAELRRRDIGQVATALHSNADLSRRGFPAYSEMEWDEPTSGWIVISLTRWAFGTAASPFDGYRWLERFAPVALIGKTVRLYYVPPRNEGPGSDPPGAQHHVNTPTFTPSSPPPMAATARATAQ